VEAACSTRTSGDFQWNTWLYISNDNTVYYVRMNWSKRTVLEYMAEEKKCAKKCEFKTSIY
jgi:hypothetical protein